MASVRPGRGAGSGAGPAMSYAGSSMPTWQLYTGLVAGLFPIVIASYEFGKRWLIQARCETCGGTGLVAARRREGSTAPVRKVKCRECGGFLPWESWELFLSSDAGNGGPLHKKARCTFAGPVTPQITRTRALIASRWIERPPIDVFIRHHLIARFGTGNCRGHDQ